MTFSAQRIVGKLSVRGRIVALAAIPVIGFLVNGVAFTTGEMEVGRAVRSAGSATALADASQDLKSALAAMRIHSRDFGARPSQDLIRKFEADHALAIKSLTAIETAADARQRQAFFPLGVRLTEVISNFSELARNQSALGFNESDGVRLRMREAAAAVERIIHEDMSWITDSDAHNLIISLLTMRRYESEYRLSGTLLLETAFFDEFKNFNKVLGTIIGPTVMKDSVADKVKAYLDAFAAWITSVGKVGPLINLIDQDTRTMMPVADEIITSARGNADRCIGGSLGVATAHQEHHHLGRLRLGADRPGVQLADRPQHRSPAERPGRAR